MVKKSPKLEAVCEHTGKRVWLRPDPSSPEGFGSGSFSAAADYGDGVIHFGDGWVGDDGVATFYSYTLEADAEMLAGHSPELEEKVEKIGDHAVELIRQEPLWHYLPERTRDYLEDAEALRSWWFFSQRGRQIPVLIMYCTVVESFLAERFFEPFRGSKWESGIPELRDAKNGYQRGSIERLREYCRGPDSDLTIREMAFCLQNVGCQMSKVPGNGFAEFLRTVVTTMTPFCQRKPYSVHYSVHSPPWEQPGCPDGPSDYPAPKDQTLIGRILEFAKTYRNLTAHAGSAKRTPSMDEARRYALDLLRDIGEVCTNDDVWRNGTTESTTIGYLNRNRQKCLGHRGVTGTDHGQEAYKMKCFRCWNEYGANGSAVSERKCPKCQGGDPGIPYL